MFRPYQLFMSGLFALAGYMIFPDRQPSETENGATPPVPSETTLCMMDNYFQFHQISQAFGAYTLPGPLDVGLCRSDLRSGTWPAPEDYVLE